MLVASLIYLKANPPLSANGISFYEKDDTKRVVELVNSGFADIKLKEVLINGNKPESVELWASTTNHMVAGGGLDDDPFITFYKINEIEIQPKLSQEEQNKLYEMEDREVIKHYGLRVFGNEAPEKINITYNYLLIPYSLEVDVME
ncbi:hypothetical protein J7E38_16685 [Bacillus sp. ISL-35]|uniref:hypothetical protein n=1 Tax=Bacillus sp. ISL-35 TaxID=2819122 RepID=UPI001BEA0B90|nr:hypothetical protein [Bacillus sp. ISL-35]MBT2680648.1 hypothetical protein [Bacillus sp. ISL-35]MBT2702721.1 hypothetical protein [Chryseobacterium sp. ISL-80]